MTVFPAAKGRFLLAASLLALGAAQAARAQDINAPSMNLYGNTGLIDMPSAESQNDGMLTSYYGTFGPISRVALAFQITPRLAGTFRYTGTRNWDDVVADKYSTYYDRSFDLSYQLLDEGQYMPAVKIGLQDFVGTELQSGEYLVATKHLTPALKVTAGLGWGRLGSYGDIGSPLGDRKDTDFGEGGTLNDPQWFKGPMAPFGGIEWQATERLSFKAEYSSDAYDEESGRRQVFEHKSPFNFGVEYRVNEVLRVSAYSMYGSEVGLSFQFTLNPAQRPAGGIIDSAPDPVLPRPTRAADPDAWSPEWVTQEGAAPILIENLNDRLKKDGLTIEAIAYTGSTARVTVRNGRYDATAQVVGRVARAMSQVMPASVESFEIVPVVNGMPAAKVVVPRSDLEALEYSPQAAAGMRAAVSVENADPLRFSGFAYDPEAYPRFRWALGPYMRATLFDPDSPFRADLGARLTASFEPAPGHVFKGSIAKPLIGDLGNENDTSDSVLPHVRSDASEYDKEGDPAIEQLTWAWYAQPAEAVYTRVTAGYLERMFGGVSTEVLWKRADSPLALGAEVNYVMQRDYDQLFGFQDYDVLTGHLSAYYEMPQGYQAQLDVGRYLAGDYGATLALNREFQNGWRVGVFATLTDVSFDDFGEGSFDKGITISMPLSWSLGTPTPRSFDATLRPLLRDGGAKLEVDGRLYESVRGYHASGLDSQWGRFWK